MNELIIGEITYRRAGAGEERRDEERAMAIENIE